MTRLQARAVLDAVRSGADVADALIDAALTTLDAADEIAPVYRAWRPAGTWESRDASVRRAEPFDGLMR